MKAKGGGEKNAPSHCEGGGPRSNQFLFVSARVDYAATMRCAFNSIVGIRNHFRGTLSWVKERNWYFGWNPLFENVVNILIKIADNIKTCTNWRQKMKIMLKINFGGVLSVQREQVLYDEGSYRISLHTIHVIYTHDCVAFRGWVWLWPAKKTQWLCKR